MIAAYDWAGGREAMVRFGPDTGPVVVVALPPFEEANRLRTLAVTMLRMLGEQGFPGALPDLPGTGESLLPTQAATLADWRAGFAAAARCFDTAYAVSLRGGVLIDTEATLRARWHFAPQTGASIVRDLMRTRLAAGEPKIDIMQDGPPVELAGNLVSRALLRELQDAAPVHPQHVVRLTSDAQPADDKIDAAPLWRRAEPDNDLPLARALAANIAHWVYICER